MNKKFGWIAGAFLSVGLCVSAASAATVSVVFSKNAATGAITTGEANDCSGYFGSGFSNCDVGNPLGVKESKSIAKFDVDSDSWEVNSAFRSDLFKDISLTNATAGSGSGSFVYTPEAGDPTIRFWVAKQSTQFRMYWEVADSLITAGTCVAGDSVSNYTAACIAGAESVSAGAWTTPMGTGLSHVTFYNGTAPGVIPLPAAGWLLIAGLGGLAALRRRKS